MTEASLRLINGLNNSSAQLRGWVMLGEPQFKSERAEAWSEWIEPSQASLRKLIDEFGTESQREQFKVVELKLKEVKEYQQQAEDIARTNKNLPAHDLMDNQLAPKANDIVAAINGMIDEEAMLDASVERKQLLYRLATFRGTLYRGMESLQSILATGNDSDRQEYLRSWQDNVKALDQIEASADLLTGSQSQNWARLKSRRSEIEPLAAKVLELRMSDKWNVAVATIRDHAAPQARVARDTLEKFISDLQPHNNANREALVSQTAFLTTLEWVLLAVGIVLSGTLGTLIIRNIRSSLSDVQRSTQEVRTASQEISTGSQQQVTSLNQTATSLNEITTTAEEFKATMQEFADRARAVQDAANETAQQSAEGRALTQESATRIDQVRANSQAAGESVLKLAEQMQRIGEITATVNEIADQTKLLALNASIEAARAGEEGRGFAVVAMQVRELANQSKEAAGRIEGLISGTQKSMQDVVQKIESGSRLSEESTEIVRRMATSFEEIAQAIQQTTSAMSQINTGAKQQEMGISELVSSITEIDSASKESLASAEQTRKAIVAIDEQIQRLDQTMTAF
jgi:methyl-accepting chemotaxis protein